MKELSIEEKARRYDEAIEVAKRNYETIVQMDEDCTFAKEGIVNTFHHMFPELKEGEDEKIRKWLIEYFNQYIIDGMPQVFGNGLNVKDVIAWLEKQGEQNPIEEYNITGIGAKNAQGKLGEMIKNIEPVNEALEQNPAWSEEKEEQESVKVFNIYEKSLLEKFKKAVYACAWGKVTCKVEGESKEEYAERWSEQFLLMTRDWADDYIDFTIQQKERRIYDEGYKDALKNLNPAWSEEDELSCFESALFSAFSDAWQSYLQGEVNVKQWAKEHSKELLEAAKEELKDQTPSAWSEEDNTFFKAIIRDIENIQYISEDAKKDRINWLKSLKDRVQQKPKQEYDDMAYEMSRAVLYDKLKDSLLPQNTWKPSDEQIEALDEVYKTHGANSACRRVIFNLLNELKKIKGE